MARTWWTPGRALLGIGLLHQAVGLAGGTGIVPMPGGEGRNLVAEVVRGGVIGAVEPDPARQLLFWYLAFGVLLLALGSALHRWEACARLPAAAGWQLAAVALGGGLLIPASGFWLALGPALWILRRARPSARGAEHELAGPLGPAR